MELRFDANRWGRPGAGSPIRIALVALTALGLLCWGAVAFGDATIFSDNFETALSGWSLTGNVSWYTGSPKNGTHSVRFTRVGGVERLVSTVGYEDVTVSFALAAGGLEGYSETVSALWYDGTTWTVLKRIRGSDSENDRVLRNYSYLLPAAANDSPYLRVRFAVSANHGHDFGYVDDVVVTGQPMQRTLSLTGSGAGSVRVDGVLQALPWSGQYTNGTQVTLEAVADAGWGFDSWSGDASGSPNPVTVTMGKDRVIAATFSQLSYTLSLAKGGSGTVKVNGETVALPYSADFLSWTEVTIEAIPAAGWEFGSWSGDVTGSGSPVVVTMDAPKSATATFNQLRYTLSLAKVGSGTVKVNGETVTLPYSAEFLSWTEVTIEAIAAAGWEFGSWSGDASGTANPVVVTMDGPRSVTATFNQLSYALSLAKVGSGTLKVNGETVALPYSGEFLSWTEVTIEAIPAAGWEFGSWSGDVTGSGSPVVVTMDAPKSATATFNQLRYTLSLAKVGSGTLKVNGETVALPYSAEFLSWTEVTVEAIAAAGWEFGSWSGDVTGSSSPVVVTMDAPKSATATFNQLRYSLSLAKVGSGTLKVNGETVALPYSGEFLSWTEVTIEAVPASGWEFGSWSGDVTGSSSPVVVTMDAPKSATATFNQLRYSLSLAKVGSGTLKVNGETVALPYSGEFLSWTEVTIEAVPASGWEFGGWSGDASGGSSPVVVTIDAPKSVTATFSQLSYLLSLGKVGSGSVKVNGEAVSLPYSEQFLSNTEITLEAVADRGWEFGSWSGDASGSSNPVIVTMDGPKSATATFNQLSYTLSVSGIGRGSAVVNGEAVSLPYSTQFLSGTEVTVEAVPQQGWGFESWTGDVSGVGNPVALDMDGDRSVTATFTQFSYTLSLAVTGTGSLKVNGETVAVPYSSEFLSGTEVTIEAVAVGSQQFVEWSGDASGSGNPLVVSMDDQMAITANFMCVEGPFADVPCDYWAVEAIAAARNAGVVQGYPDGLYRPGVAVDRAAMAVYLARALTGGDDQVPAPSVTQPTFGDVPTDHWAYRAIEYAAANGIVQGYGDGSYQPKWEVTRGQMAVFVARSIAEPIGEAGLASYQPPSAATFADVPTSTWCYKHVEYLAEEGTVLGYPDGLYRPTAVVTRDQMAVYVARAFGLVD